MSWYKPVALSPETCPAFDLKEFIEVQEKELKEREENSPKSSFYIARDREKLKDLTAIYEKFASLTHYPLWVRLQKEFNKLQPGDTIYVMYHKNQPGEPPEYICQHLKALENGEAE